MHASAQGEGVTLRRLWLLVEVGHVNPNRSARSTFVTHRGQRILRLDHSELDEQQLLTKLAADARLIQQCAPRSLLLLTIPVSPPSAAAVEAVKGFLRSSAPLIKASAVVRPGKGFAAAFIEMMGAYIENHFGYERRCCDDESSALEWLSER